MLTPVLAHQGRPLAPHDLWGAWSFDPLLLLSLVLAGWTYIRGGGARRRQEPDVWRRRCFIGGLVAVGLALASPLDALAGALASAHMVQHVLLLLVAAPLLALSSPLHRIIRGSPAGIRQIGRKWSRRHASTWRHALRSPAGLWMAHVGVIWTWHASVPYEAALRHDLVHMLEHASFFVTGVLFWSVVVGGRGTRQVSHGYGIALVFAMALQSVFLSALLTFAETPWYTGYTTTTTAWGLDPLADQQLAGVIMWIPAGAVYLIAALALLAYWIRHSDRPVTVLSP